ncbi:MAG: hypothetical protein ACJAV6_000349 [Candidatus Paceibacteria bacterium]|jgi:hypothetical protein
MNRFFKKTYLIALLILAAFAGSSALAQFEIDGEIVILGETITISYLDPASSVFLSGDIEITYDGFDVQFCLVADGQTENGDCFAEIPWTASPSYIVNFPVGTIVSPPVISDGTFNYHTLNVRRLELATGNSELVDSFPLAGIFETENSGDTGGNTGGDLPTSAPLTSVELSYTADGLDPTLTALVQGDEDYYVNLYLHRNDGGTLSNATAAGSILWNNNNSLSVTFEGLGVLESSEVLFQLLDPGTKYDSIHVTATHESNGEETEVLQVLPLSILIGGGTIDNDDNNAGGGNGGGQTSGFLIDFPGWELADFAPINENGLGGFYPILKSKGRLTRTEPEALYLILQNLSTLERTLLNTYASGPDNSFLITWPDSCDSNLRPHCGIPTESNLSPGLTYAVYLSDNPEGINAIATGSSKSTYKVLDPVPDIETDLVEMLQVENVDNKYFSINGIFSGLATTDVVFRAVQNNRPGEELFLGVASLEPGAFVFPAEDDDPTPQPIEGSEVYTISIYYDGDIVDQYILNGDGTGTNIEINPGGGSGGVNINTSVDDVIENGIAVTDCGYDIGKNGNGRMCGFSDVILLIARVIEYIFVLIIPIAAIVFAYAGFLYLTSGGDPGKKTAAKKAMTNVIIGIVIVMSAWLVVRTIVVSLGVDPNSTWFLLG